MFFADVSLTDVKVLGNATRKVLKRMDICNKITFMDGILGIVYEFTLSIYLSKSCFIKQNSGENEKSSPKAA